MQDSGALATSTTEQKSQGEQDINKPLLASCPRRSAPQLQSPCPTCVCEPTTVLPCLHFSGFSRHTPASGRSPVLPGSQPGPPFPLPLQQIALLTSSKLGHAHLRGQRCADTGNTRANTNSRTGEQGLHTTRLLRAGTTVPSNTGLRFYSTDPLGQTWRWPKPF